jgi:RNA polymerase sigma factor (sigma-70 family)
MQGDSLSDLIRAAQRGDAAATNELLGVIRPELDRLARVWDATAGPGESASDIVQDAEVRIWERLPQFRAVAADGDLRVAFRAWFAAIVRTVGANANRARHAQRRAPSGGVQSLDELAAGGSHGRGLAFDPAGSEWTPGTKAQANEEAVRVRQAIDALPDASIREIVHMRFYEGASLKEIADRLGISTDTASDRLHAGLRSLERTLASLK